MNVTILQGDAITKLRELKDNSVHCCITSPPYWGLRDYEVEGQIGLEPTIEEYIAKIVEVFREVRRILRPDGTLWLNLGDSYSGGDRTTYDSDNKLPNRCHSFRPKSNLKPKDLCMIPARVALALQDDGWYLRSDIIWSKPNPMPESCLDRPTSAHEHIFLLTRRKKYFFDAEAIKEKCVSGPSDIQKMQESKERIGGFYKDSEDLLAKASKHTNIGKKRSVGCPSGRNCRNVWEFATEPFPGSHFAVFPKELVRRCISAGTSEKGCCPQCGAPWHRIVERKPMEFKPSNRNFEMGVAHGKRYVSGTMIAFPTSTTIRWQPSCKCVHNETYLIPSTVLDPFGGSGTAGLVAAKMGRCAILIELKQEYGKMAMKRIRHEMGFLAEVNLS